MDEGSDFSATSPPLITVSSFFFKMFIYLGFPGGSDLRICLQCGIPRFNPWVGNIPWRRNGDPLQYSCLESSKDRGAWRAEVRGVAESDATEGLTLRVFGCSGS